MVITRSLHRPNKKKRNICNYYTKWLGKHFFTHKFVQFIQRTHYYLEFLFGIVYPLKGPNYTLIYCIVIYVLLILILFSVSFSTNNWKHSLFVHSCWSYLLAWHFVVADVSTFVDVYLLCCGFCIHGLSDVLWNKMFLLSEEITVGLVVVFVFTDCRRLWYNMFLLSEKVPIGFVVVFVLIGCLTFCGIRCF